MSALLELAERVEALTRPDRWLDGEIYVALNIPTEQVGRIDHERGVVGWHPLDAPYQSAIETPPVTASLDAALTLVPEGYSWAAGDCGEDGAPWACVTSPLDADKDGGCKDFGGSAATPALTLCAASLRARAAGESA